VNLIINVSKPRCLARPLTGRVFHSAFADQKEAAGLIDDIVNPRDNVVMPMRKRAKQR
jgi:hypothetical protein